MGDDFFSYLERLELLGFFSAYPLIFALIFVMAGVGKQKIIKGFPSLLPYAYGLVGILFLGLQLKNLYPDYSIEHIKAGIQQPLLKIWALLAILFWIPALAKKPVISLIHSFVFFYFLLRDLFSPLFGSSVDKNILRNDMKVYTDSLLINLGTFVFILLLFFLFRRSEIRSKTWTCICLFIQLLFWIILPAFSNNSSCINANRCRI